ncbi:MAG: hypothetical protein JXA21_23465 [Anaerolineae bacterium]|nr:hypothetical protein [Anaerolineae bacterium]
MSERLTLRQSVPSEVGELWAQLHAEAQENCVALKPQTSRRALFIVIAASILVMVAAFFSANEFWFKPQEAARVATATARALALDDSSRATATAMAATATSEAMQGKSALDATATAQAATATFEAQQGQAVLAGTATAQAATATAQAQASYATATAEAESLRCSNPNLYTLEVSPTPQFEPPLGYTWNTDRPWPAVYAAWVVTNTSSCMWQSVQLKTLAGETMDVKLFRDGEELAVIDARASATVRLYFPREAAPTQGEWILVINGLTLFDLPHLRLDLGEEQWIVAVTPTPTPTLTPTATPTPTPTPAPTVCTTVCDKCEECKTNSDGETVCTQVDCNCREECH